MTDPPWPHTGSLGSGSTVVGGRWRTDDQPDVIVVWSVDRVSQIAAPVIVGHTPVTSQPKH